MPRKSPSQPKRSAPRNPADVSVASATSVVAVVVGSVATAVIVTTAFGTVETAIEAIKTGAYDYIPKPFKLDEVREADVLLHVVDISHPQYEDQYAVVNKTLQDLNCHDKPVISIFNKLDLYEERTFDSWLDPEVKKQMLQDLQDRWNRETGYNAVFVSATEKWNIEGLRKTILDKVRAHYAIRYPYKTMFY